MEHLKKPLIDGTTKFYVQIKRLPQEGNLAYEYNPFRNYRLDEDLYEYEDNYYTLSDLAQLDIIPDCTIIAMDGDKKLSMKEFNEQNYNPSKNITYLISKNSDQTLDRIYTKRILIRNIYKDNLKRALHDYFTQNKLTNWSGVPKNKTEPILREAGELVDFITPELEFDLEHPVSLLPQKSYDNSVNLIINDGKTYPKLINNRFSVKGRNQYEIIDRKGTSDTNIYDRGEQFKSDTSLYKITEKFAKIKLKGVSYGGNLKVGNYFFYFKLADSDGNESDFIGESGLVSIFLGNSYKTARTGERDNNSSKKVSFYISNLDTSYTYVHVYYSRTSAEIWQNSTTTYAQIDRKYLISSNGTSNIEITGFEEVIDKTLEDINCFYSIVESAEAQEQCQNMLFLANVQKTKINYTELEDLSLRVLPYLNEEEYKTKLSHKYSLQTNELGYVDPTFIYNKTGYWNEELYRFGIVYILNNGELSPVFNIRGALNINSDIKYSDISLRDDNGVRNYIQYDEETYQLKNNTKDDSEEVTAQFENSKGVVRLTSSKDTNIIHSFKFIISDEVKQEMQKYARGFFIVRQKRMPMLLVQGVTLGVDKHSRTPTIPTAGPILSSQASKLQKTNVTVDNINGVNYISEGFLSRYHYYFKRKKGSIWSSILKVGALVVGAAALAVATVFTCGVAGAVTGAITISAIATAATSTAVTGAVATAATIAGIAAGSVITASVVAAATQSAILASKSGKTTLDGWRTKTPSGFTKEEEDDSRRLTQDFKERMIIKDPSKNEVQCILSPEYETNIAYFNTIFSGNTHHIQSAISQNQLQIESEDGTIIPYFAEDSIQPRHFYIKDYYDNIDRSNAECPIIAIQDSQKVGAVEDILFKARAGEAEEVFRYSAISSEHLKNSKDEYAPENLSNIKANSDIIRGSFGPYLGFINGNFKPAEIVNIYFPGYDESLIEEYASIRANDKSPFKAVTERISFTDMNDYSNQLISSNINQGNKEYVIHIYRGDCFICQTTHRLNRNFNDPSALYNDQIIDPDTWKENYDPEDTSTYEKINLGDVNAIQMGMWITFKIRSSSNLNLCTLDESNSDEMASSGHPRGHYPQTPMSVEGTYKIPDTTVFNQGFKNTVGDRNNFEVPDVPYLKQNFQTRIMYSDIYITDAFKNGYRSFWGTNYRDYTNQYGCIIQLINIQDNLLCVFEHGIALIPVNERAVAAEGAGGQAYINTSNVLPENPRIISDTYGSQWKESIIKTDSYIYGVDTITKKIWRTNGSNFEVISDFKVQEFLNQNISLTEREVTPIIGIRNVKSHWNKFKNDVMFTFYDNKYDFEEVSWNLCFNEVLGCFTTFYSWIPSYSENIYNQYFSFDRDTSKHIAKLGISNANNDFADGITLSSNVFKNNSQTESGMYKVGILSLTNRNLPVGDGIEIEETFTLERDYQLNNKNFEIRKIEDEWWLLSKVPAWELSTEQYCRIINNKKILDISDIDDWKSHTEANSKFIYKDNTNRRKEISGLEEATSHNKVITYLNISCSITVKRTSEDVPFADAYANGFNEYYTTNAGQFKSRIAIIPEYNLQFLITDFWKHGQSGIIDIKDQILPTHWYGHQHPFEFEFIVNQGPDTHKIFDNLQIISNSAEPESFHYEIIGDCFDFAKDKKNMYIRQEATKQLYQYNGSDIVYDHDYKKLHTEEHRPLLDQDYNPIIGQYDKSTIMPLFYCREDRIDYIHDLYFTLESIDGSHNYDSLSGGEIAYNPTTKEYSIINHVKAVNMQDPKQGRMYGNMHYKEDKWHIQINPLKIVQKNEEDWSEGFIKNSSSKLIPVELWKLPIPNEKISKDATEEQINPEQIELPLDWGRRNIVKWGDLETQWTETKMKGNYIKIKIRYKGDKLAIIQSLRTLFSISYG